MSYLIAGGSQKDQLIKIEEIADNLGLKLHQNNPDILLIRPEKSIGIDQIRQVKSFLYQKSWRGGGKKLIVVFQAELITPAAQNAFLKTLEEPPANSTIILATNNQSSLLSTIISRCQIVTLYSNSKVNKDTSFKEWQRIIESPISKRLAIIQNPTQKELFQWIENYLFCLQKELTKGEYLFQEISNWLKLLTSAQQMLNHNLSPQSVVDWLMIRL